MVEIFELRQQHIEQVTDIIADLSDSFFYEREAVAARTYLQEVLEDGGRTKRQWIAVDGRAQVIGTLGYRSHTVARDLYELSWVVVAEQQQGQGIGTRLWRIAEQDLRSRGARMVQAWTSNRPYTWPARRFYESIGFVCESIVPDYWEDGDDLAIYVLRLLPPEDPRLEDR